MTDEELRMQCLELVVRNWGLSDVTVGEAQKLYDWVKGGSAQTED